MNYFGTDGIRGNPLKNLSLDLVSKVSRSITFFDTKQVIIGTDTRQSKDMLAFQMIAGCLSQGLDVEYVGVISTPGLFYLSKLKSAIGIMITASHNPYFDNGIKIVYKGEKISLAEEEKIEALIGANDFKYSTIGKFTFNPKAIKDYHLMLSKYLVPTNLKIAIDCANGATYQTAALLFHLVTPTLEIIGDKPNGININEKCGSTHLEALTHLVVSKQYDLGIAFDGDGDRVLFVDKNGNEVSGDCLIYILACYYKQKNALNDNKIALTVMSNPGIIRALNNKGIEVIETPVGDKYIIEAIKKYNLSMGGEANGHIILSNTSVIGDGIRNAMILIGILEDTHTTLEDWLKDIILYPNCLQNIYVSNKNMLMAGQLTEEIQKMKEEANGDCKIIVRPSGTENCIRISVMAKTKELVNNFKDRLKDFILSLDA